MLQLFAVSIYLGSGCKLLTWCSLKGHERFSTVLTLFVFSVWNQTMENIIVQETDSDVLDVILCRTANVVDCCGCVIIPDFSDNSFTNLYACIDKALSRKITVAYS
jgi:hypothetical protein